MGDVRSTLLSNGWRTQSVPLLYDRCSYLFYSPAVLDIDSSREKLSTLAGDGFDGFEVEELNRPLVLATANASLIASILSSVSGDLRRAREAGESPRQSNIHLLVTFDGEYQALKCFIAENFRMYATDGASPRLQARADAALDLSQELISRLFQLLSVYELNESVALSDGGLRQIGPVLRGVVMINSEMSGTAVAVQARLESVSAQISLS